MRIVRADIEKLLTIVRAEVEELRIPLRRPFVTSQGTVTTRRGFLLRLVADGEVTGLGEASPAYWIGEGSVEGTAADLRAVVALVATRPSAARLRDMLLEPQGSSRDTLRERRDGHRLSAAAACALDTALLDLAARVRGVAVTSLLGGEPTSPLFACALIAGETPEALADEARAAVTRGFRTLKIKVGSAAIHEDVQRVAAVREHAGAAVTLRLDANRAWAPEEAQRALAAFEQFGIEFIEEPLRDAEPRALAALQSSTHVPVALDETVTNSAGLQRVMEAGAAPVVVLKAARLGGPTRVLELARAAQAKALRVVVTDSIETAIGMGAAVHAGAALPAPRLALGLGGGWLLDAHPFPAPSFRAVGPGLDVRALPETQSAGHA
jgi:o-succinylbenzoate synthase